MPGKIRKNPLGSRSQSMDGEQVFAFKEKSDCNAQLTIGRLDLTDDLILIFAQHNSARILTLHQCHYQKSERSARFERSILELKIIFDRLDPDLRRAYRSA